MLPFLTFHIDDGWVLAKNNKTLAVGLLPRNFLVTRDSQQMTSDNLSASERRSSLIVRQRNDDSGRGPTKLQNEVANGNTSDVPTSPPVVDNETRTQIALDKWHTVQKSLANRVNCPANIGCLRVSIVGDSGIGKVSNPS